MAVTRRQAAANLFKRVPSVVFRQGVHNFGERVSLVAQGARARREPAVTTPALVDTDLFKLLEAVPLGCDLRAFAIWAPLRRFNRRRRP